MEIVEVPSEYESETVRFLVIQEGTEVFILVGGAWRHSELWQKYCAVGKQGPPKGLVGAGLVPRWVSETSIDEDVPWGGWHSTDFDTTTPQGLRSSIRDALLAINEEVWLFLTGRKEEPI